MKDYTLTIRFSIKAIDNLEARQKMKAFLEEHDIDKENVKLQEIRKDGPPIHIPI